MRGALVVVIAGGLLTYAVLPVNSLAQEAIPALRSVGPPVEQFAGPWPREWLSAEQIERLVGPIALYPDPLLAQVLPASTYPVDIVKAARLIRGSVDEAAIVASELDVSVKALTRNPEVVALMDEHLEWTERLGQAYLEQPDDVMRSVQRLRTIAQGLGNLATNGQQEVLREREIIRIVPVTEYVYVPTYLPSVVYERACPSSSSFVTYRSCSRIGTWYDLDCDWRRRTVCRRDGWSWRDYCDHRCRTGWAFTFNWSGNDDERSVHCWRHDPDRGGHFGGPGREHDRDLAWRDRDGRDPPRAAEPNPPQITVRPPPPTPSPISPRSSEPGSKPTAPATKPPRVDRTPPAPPIQAMPPAAKREPKLEPRADRKVEPAVEPEVGRSKRDAKDKSPEPNTPVTAKPKADTPDQPAAQPVTKPSEPGARVQEKQARPEPKNPAPRRDFAAPPSAKAKPADGPKVPPKPEVRPQPVVKVDRPPVAKPIVKPAPPTETGPKPARPDNATKPNPQIGTGSDQKKGKTR